LNAGHIWFRDTGSYVIIPDASTNQSWLYDTLNAITAEITDISSVEIFPAVIDLVKTITLSDGNEILLSKNHGILKYPVNDPIIQYYQIQGLQTVTEQIGNTPPAFHDYFNFDEGDVFQYWAGAGDGSYPPPNSDTYIIKILITSKEQNDDFVKYGRHVIKKSTFFGGLDVWDDEVRFENNPESFVNYEPNTLYNFCADSIGLDACYTYYDNAYSKIRLETFALDPELTSICNYTIPADGNIFGICNNDSAFAGKNTDPIYHCFISFTEGLGFTQYSYAYFEQSNDFIISGYVKDGDTVGTITPDGILLGVDEKISEQQINIYPNPASENVIIEINGAGNSSATLEIYDLSGRLVKSLFDGKLSMTKSNFSWDMSTQSGSCVKPGIYFCRWVIGQQSGMRKIVVI
nr:T9SS type A sorting domain-containing protein [Bacteroidota bacterium]